MCESLFFLVLVVDVSDTHTTKARPVGWGCRIRRLHLCRGVNPTTNEATCWPWVATRKALGRIPGGWAVIDPVTEWSLACNTSLWPLLGLTGGRIGPDPINRLVPTCPSTYVGCFFFYFPDRIIQSALVELFDILLQNYFQPSFFHMC